MGPAFSLARIIRLYRLVQRNYIPSRRPVHCSRLIRHESLYFPPRVELVVPHLVSIRLGAQGEGNDTRWFVLSNNDS